MFHQLVNGRPLPYKQPLFGAWELNVYPPYRSLRFNDAEAYTVTITADWKDLHNYSASSEKSPLTWCFNSRNGCWTQNPSFETTQSADVHYMASVEDLLKREMERKEYEIMGIYPISATDCCPFAKVQDQSIQFRRVPRLQYRYIYFYAHTQLSNVMEELKTKLSWPTHLHPPPQSVKQSLRILMLLSSIALFPPDINLLVIEHLLPAHILDELMF